MSSADFRFERVAWEQNDWPSFESYSDCNLYQSRAWIEFLAEIQGGEPVAAVLTDGRQEAGRFHGLIVRKLGLKFLGSPLPGWTTPYMGFNLLPGIPRRLAAEALLEFAFKDLGCIHLELRDRWLDESHVEDLGFKRRADVGYDDRTFEIDLSRGADAVFSDMSSPCRRNIRQAEKRGVTIEEASDNAFAAEFFDQITEVFLHQGLIPTYKQARVEALIRHLQPANQLLLLRARSATGECIATGIYPAYGKTALFWGGASRKEHQGNRPNEALHWYAMQYWMERGIATYDMGGFMEYKRKYGGEEVSIPGFRRSRSPVIATARTFVPNAVRAKQRLIGRIHRGRIESASGAALPVLD